MALAFSITPNVNCWRVAEAERAALIVDAADYFRLARSAMLEARSQIMLIGWDFDTRVVLDPDCRDDAPSHLGGLLSWLADQRPQLEIRILNWNFGAIKLLGRGSTVFRLGRWMAHPRITFRLDDAHPLGACHHHKVVVIDDRLAFCGGIDMTAARWDTREHRDGDGRRRRPTTGRRYGPWHDASMALSGAAARAMGDYARERWRIAGGGAVGEAAQGSDPWPSELEPDFRDFPVAIARTVAAYDGRSSIREIEQLYLDMIAGTRHCFYAENQYFASRAIAAAIAKRLGEPDGPEFVLIQPCSAEGFLEAQVMDNARARLINLLRRADRYGRFRIYTPVTSHGEDIYVHSKLTIVDDMMIRVGSANMNNRSMGFDSECDVMIDARLSDSKVRNRIAGIRTDLLAEHLGADMSTVESALHEHGSLLAAIEHLRGAGRTLRPLKVEPPASVQEAVADSELLDPEGAEEPFEPLARPGLLAGLRHNA